MKYLRAASTAVTPVSFHAIPSFSTRNVSPTNPQDHDVIVEDKTGNSRFLSIAGGPEVVDFLAGYKR